MKTKIQMVMLLLSFSAVPAFAQIETVCTATVALVPQTSGSGKQIEILADEKLKVEYENQGDSIRFAQAAGYGFDVMLTKQGRIGLTIGEMGDGTLPFKKSISSDGDFDQSKDKQHFSLGTSELQPDGRLKMISLRCLTVDRPRDAAGKP